MRNIMQVNMWSLAVFITVYVIFGKACAAEWEVYNEADDSDFFAEEIFLPTDKVLSQKDIHKNTVAQNIDSNRNVQSPLLSSSLETPTLKAESTIGETSLKLENTPVLDNNNIHINDIENFSEQSSSQNSDIKTKRTDTNIRSDENFQSIESELTLNIDINEDLDDTLDYIDRQQIHDRDLPGRSEELFMQPILPQPETGIDCPPGSDRWECLMFREDLLMARKDRNLSGAETAHHRSKRQTTGNNNNNNNTTTNNNNNDDDIDASGDGNAFYPDSEEKSPTISLDNSFVFQPLTNVPFDAPAFENQLARELRESYNEIPGFEDIVIDSITLRPDGTVEANFTLKIDSGPAEYAQLTTDEYLDRLDGDLRRVGAVITSDLDISGRRIISQTPVSDLTGQASESIADPCAGDPCSFGFHLCTVLEAGSRQFRCEHKCETFENSRSCEHGSTCELNGDGKPYCACTKRWSGDYCQQAVKDNDLDGGEIAGAALGAAVLAAGLVGTCCYLLACRRGKSDVVFSHYSDEEGSGNFSNPSSKLSNFVIDRPRISIAPISTFNPTAPSASLSSNNSGPPRRNGRYSSA